MTLLIAGQDIAELRLGLIFSGTAGQTSGGQKEFHLEKEAAVATNPEGALRAIDGTLKMWGVDLDDLDGVAVVIGPGSFTSSRVTVTIANALAFTRGLPLYALENPQRLPLARLVQQLATIQPVPHGFALPSYDRPPQITLSKS